MNDTPRTSYIYGLKDPLSGYVRYIGKSINPKIRLKDHLDIKGYGVSHKERWILSLRKLGFTPYIAILEITTLDKAAEREKFWIAEYRSLGITLTNQTEGGDGGRGSGFRHSEDTKHKMRIAKLGKAYSDEARANMSNAAKVSQIGNKNLLGHRHSKESREKMSVSQIGNKNATGKRSLEARLKMSLAQKERHKRNGRNAS